MDAAGIRLYLTVVPEADFQGRATIYFGVDDVSGAYGRLLARGAKARQQPHIPYPASDYDLWMAFVTDPDGNQIGIMREAQKGADRRWTDAARDRHRGRGRASEPLAGPSVPARRYETLGFQGLFCHRLVKPSGGEGHQTNQTEALPPEPRTPSGTPREKEGAE